MKLDDEQKDALIKRMRRLEGQIRGLQRMVDEEQGCEQVLTQVSACKAALEKIGVFIIAHGMKECLSRGEFTRDETGEAGEAGEVGEVENGRAPQIDPAVIEQSLELFTKHFSRII